MTEVCFKRTMQLDHVTIVANDCRRLRDFFVEVAGMQDGPRPPFAVAGHWLYLGHKAVLHLIERPSPSGAPVVQSRESAARIDHLALRVDSAAQWEQELTSSFPTIKQTALHIVSAQKIWLDFWAKTPEPVFLSAKFTGTKMS